MDLDLTFKRRTALLASGAAAAQAVLPSRARSSVADLPVDSFDPMRPLDHLYEQIRPALFDQQFAQAVVERMWRQFKSTGDPRYAEWAMMYTYNLWRMVPLGQPRARTARIGLRMAGEFKNARPNSVVGPFWSAIYIGLDALSRGILETVQNLPEFQRLLDFAEEIDPNYIYGMVLTAQAKMLIKVPPFPISVGNIDKGMEYLERAKPLQEGVFALWYLFLAEARYLQEGPESWFATLDLMKADVKPVDGASAFVLETSLIDGAALRKAIETNTYNKYKWDPLLTPIVPAK